MCRTCIIDLKLTQPFSTNKISALVSIIIGDEVIVLPKKSRHGQLMDLEFWRPTKFVHALYVKSSAA